MTTHAIYELLYLNLDCKGNFYRALANDPCDVIHFLSHRKENVFTTLSYFAFLFIISDILSLVNTVLAKFLCFPRVRMNLKSRSRVRGRRCRDKAGADECIGKKEGTWRNAM